MIGGVPCLAPIHSLPASARAVDVGCGTGVATLQIASMLPSVKFYGLDITEVPEPARKMAPANVSWVVGNVLNVDVSQPDDDTMHCEIFTPDGLDYVFGRKLFLRVKKWQRYFATAYHSLKSGGLIEH